jgi:predicted secreted hydrolase
VAVPDPAASGSRNAVSLHAMLSFPLRRRVLLLAALPGAAAAEVRRGRSFTFPRDHGAHLEAGTEWWYATGWSGTPEAPQLGFQVTFFRSRSGAAAGVPGRFAARHVLFAHAAVTDLGAKRHLHAQRLARWSGDAAAGPAFAATDDARVRLDAWSFVREAAGYRTRTPADDFTLDLTLVPSQPPMLQGDAGFSRKGPLESQASHYYSEPQLAARGSVTLGARVLPVDGRAWLDREWSDAYLAPEAVGWDWTGMNLFDGSALMAFSIRRADGSALWAGGGWRPPGGAMRSFAPTEVRFTPGRRWRSPATRADYPVAWTVDTPAGRFALNALLDAQELDSRGNTGAVYWEGLCELNDERGRRIGMGYLEMTGYAGRLRMG